jgi:CubicO group peptidase (beta-lactamase class C family)
MGKYRLKMLIEKVTGESAEKEVAKRIIEPLDIDNTRYLYPCDPKAPDPHLDGYIPAGSDPATADPGRLRDITDMTPFSEGIIFNLGDLKVWAKAFANGDLLSKKMQEYTIILRVTLFNVGESLAGQHLISNLIHGMK